MENFNKTLKSLIQQGANFDNSTALVEHKGRAGEYETVSYHPPRGRESDFVAFCKDFETQYNEASREAAIDAIEGQMATEAEAERVAEQNRMLAESEAEKQRKEAEKALKAEHEKVLEVQRAKLQSYEDERASKKNKATKWIMIVALVFMFMASGVTMFLNIHNLEILFGKILPFAVLVVFALFLSFVPIIYAWFKNKMKVEAATIIGPVDIVVAVTLFYLLSDASFLYNVEWVTSNKEIIQLIVSFIGSIFYAYQLYMTFNELYAILSDKKYEEFFNKLFE